MMRRTRWTIPIALVIAASLHWGCEQSGSSLNPATSSVGVENTSTSGSASALALPVANFRTTPAADANGKIVGQTPLEVRFNLCRSSDDDADDSLKFTFDFNNDGKPEQSSGFCRASNIYRSNRDVETCSKARVCVTDRHADTTPICKTYDVCPFGGPEIQNPISTLQTISGDNLRSGGDQDVYAFTGTPGTSITVRVDTVASSTAFDLVACLATIPNPTSSTQCFGYGDDNFACTFPPPAFGCPQFTTTLPASASGTYYLIIESFWATSNFAGPVGQYLATVTTNPGVGSMNLISNNQPGTLPSPGIVDQAADEKVPIGGP